MSRPPHPRGCSAPRPAGGARSATGPAASPARHSPRCGRDGGDSAPRTADTGPPGSFPALQEESVIYFFSWGGGLQGGGFTTFLSKGGGDKGNNKWMHPGAREWPKKTHNGT